MKRKRLITASILLVFAIIPTLIYVNESYSKYKKGVNITTSTTTAELICDATLDNPGTYVSDKGFAYFKVIAKNYDSNNNITKVPIEYHLNITNQEGYEASYRYLDASGYKSSFLQDQTTNDYTFSTTSKQSQEFIVEVRTDSTSIEEVDFSVNLSCYQIAE